MSEKELIEGCLIKDAKSEKKLYETFAPKMFTVCLRYAGNYHLAQDILQDGFVNVFLNLKQFRFEGSFEGWVRRLMVTTALKEIKKKMNIVALEKVENAEAEENDDGNEMMQGFSATDLMDVIQNMPSGYRTVFNLYVFEEFSHSEIAEELQISEGTSKSQLAKARKFLQEKINSLKNYKTATHA